MTIWDTEIYNEVSRALYTNFITNIGGFYEDIGICGSVYLFSSLESNVREKKGCNEV